MNRSEQRSERIRQKGKALEAELQKEESNPIAREMTAGLLASLIFKEDIDRQFQNREEAFEVAKQLNSVPTKKPTEEELKQRVREAGVRFAKDHINEVLFSSAIKKGTKEELNLARICKLVGADPKTTDLGVDKAKTKKVIRNYKKMDAETLGLVDQAKKRILINWSVPVDLKDKNGSDLKLPLAGMNLVTAVRALGWVSWNTEGSQLQKATERYRKITDRLRLTRKDKKCHKKT